MQIPDSLITTAPVTYVIIADPSFHDALQSFIIWKKKKGFNVITGYTNNQAVGTTTTSIKNYLKGLYNNPPIGYQKPSFVLFAGDVRQIPTWTSDYHPTDLYYCDYTGDNIHDVYTAGLQLRMWPSCRLILKKPLNMNNMPCLQMHFWVL